MSEGLQQAVAQVCPRLWRQLDAGPAMTVATHAEGVWRQAAAVGIPRHTLLRRARHSLRTALGEQLGHTGFDTEAALAQFDRIPLLQTSDHAQLLLDPVTFYTNLCFFIGAQRRGARFLFVNTCSTITLETRAGSGPGWLTAGGERVNVFGLPRRQLARSSVCGRSRPVRFVLRSGAANPAAELATALDGLRQRLPIDAFDSPAAAFEAANTSLWRGWDGRERSTLAYTDDRLTAAAVAHNLEDAEGVLFRLLFEPALRSRFRSALALARQGVGRHALPKTTELFWGMRDGRVRALCHVAGWLQEPGGTGFRCRFEPAAIMAGLREGVLFPDLCLGFLAISILPRVMVTGGSSQLIYVPLIAAALREALAGEQELEEAGVELSEGPEDGWLAGVIEAHEHPLLALSRAPEGEGLRLMADRWADVPLTASIGTGALFSYLEIWRDAVS